MKKYNSRFNTLIKIKSKKEEAAQKELTNLLIELEEIKNKKLHLEQQVLQLTIDQKDDNYSVENAEAATNYIEYVHLQKEELSKIIDKKVLQVDKARHEMIETMKQKKVIVNIENKEKDKWKKKSEKQEEQHFDEISTSRFLKKKHYLKQQLKSHEEKDRKYS